MPARRGRPGDGLLADGRAGLVLLGDEPDEGRRTRTGGPAGLGLAAEKTPTAAEIAGAVRAVAAGLIALDPEFLPLLTGADTRRRRVVPATRR